MNFAKIKFVATPPKEIQSCMLQGMPSLGEILWLCHGARACHSSFELFAVTLVYVQAREEIPPPVSVEI